MTFLGSIPRFKRKGPVLISDKDPKDYVSESYRTVRNSLKFLALDKPVNSVMVTSCVENEGKTTTLANLGISMCREKKRVILVDADLRRPKLHEVIGIYENNLGLSTVISGEATAEEATVATDIEGLNLIPSGPVPPDPGTIVESVQMGELIKLLGREYDMVLIDTPPVLVSTDALIIARDTDATLLVMESDRINKRAISQTLQRFENANLYPAGAILNKCKVSRSDYLSYQYYRYKRSGR
jgi:capsular exopolysaccharide synthesis family protein